MKEELISFETAKLAKEKGFKFNEESENIYKKNADTGKIITVRNFKITEKNPYYILLDGEIYPAPTQSLLQKWLREVHNIIVTPVYLNKSKDYEISITDSDNIQGNFFNTKFTTYESALEQGLKIALNLI